MWASKVCFRLSRLGSLFACINSSSSEGKVFAKSSSEIWDYLVQPVIEIQYQIWVDTALAKATKVLLNMIKWMGK